MCRATLKRGMTWALVTCWLSWPALAADGPGGPPPLGPSATVYQSSYDEEAVGSYDAALRALDKLPATHKEAYLAQLRRGWLFTRMGRWDEAATAYERAVSVMPGSVEARLGLLTAQAALRRWTDLEATARQVLERDAANYTATLKLAFALYSLARYPEAEAGYRKLSALYPGDLDVRSGIAWSLLKQGKGAEATKAFQELLNVAPRQPFAYDGLKAAGELKK
jgi:tetratricopeptide (TPR) repeat protein